jgi:hypothetical protein
VLHQLWWLPPNENDTPNQTQRPNEAPFLLCVAVFFCNDNYNCINFLCHRCINLKMRLGDKTFLTLWFFLSRSDRSKRGDQSMTRATYQR